MERRARVADVVDPDLEPGRRGEHAELAVEADVHRYAGHGAVVDAGHEGAGMCPRRADADRAALLRAGVADDDVVAPHGEVAAGVSADHDVALPVDVPPCLVANDDVVDLPRATAH